MNKKLKGKIIERFGSQFEFARKIAAHEADVSRVIRGRKDLSQDERDRWAKILQCKPADIFQE